MSVSPQAIWQGRQAPEIIVITGESGAGKTTWCEAMRIFAERQGLQVAGLISYGVFEGAEKVAITLCALPGGERRRLAVRREQVIGAATPRWAFDQAVLDWGNAHLAALGACDVLIIDELGPLELIHRQGWQSAFEVLAMRRYQVACVAVRPTLVANFTARFSVARVVWP
ncbi:MAG: nucleoside-triphosphatase [Aggregatilineales bacterium]